MTILPKVTALVLSYNSAAYLPVCLEELRRQRGVELEVLVVDNDSKDGSAEVAEKAPGVSRVIRTGANLGCAGGNNAGVREAKHPYVVLVNPDCALEGDAIARAVQVLIDDESVGVVGGKLYYPNSRKLQHCGGIIHANAMAEHHGMGEQDTGRYDTPADVDYVTGAFLAVRREEWLALGGFDEDFNPAYYEETDFCRRMRAAGKRVRYVPDAVGYHWESAGLGILTPRMVRMSYRARMIYVVKNHTLGSFMTSFLPFEWRWFWGPFAKGFRLAVLRSYCSGAIFAGRCLFRLRKQPRGVTSVLPPR